MKIKDYKCKCGHNDFFFADKGNQKGIYCLYCGKWIKWADKDEQNLIMKQDSCIDTVSRQTVKEEMIKYGFHSKDMTVTEFVEDLQPVLPQPKTGEWIERKNLPKSVDIDTANLLWRYECSECGYETRSKYHYCPNCGVKMEMN